MNVFDENNVAMDTMDAASAEIDGQEEFESVSAAQADGYSEQPIDEPIDKHEAYARKGRNQEYYRDPTYTSVRRNNEYQMHNPGYFGKDRARNNYETQAEPYTAAPIYKRRKSRRYEVIGLIIRILDISGFELADRIVLRDKETGEILR